MRFAFILIIALVAIWLILSGYFKVMLLTLGVISIAIVVWICARMRILDNETVPYETSPQTLSYFSWLFGEIVKANIQVVKAVLKPDMEISPTMTKIPLSNNSDLAKTMLANSITLTPGTVSVDMQDDYILVHALLKEMSKPTDFQEMSERSAWSVGEKAGEG